MIEIEDVDMWTMGASVHVITTNGVVNARGEAVMGRGCAREAASRWPQLSKYLGGVLLGSNHVHDLGEWVFNSPRHRTTSGRFHLVNFPVKHRWWDRADLDLIARSAGELRRLVDGSDWELIVVPRPGCGNGRVKWEEVKPLLTDLFDDRFLVVSK